MTQRGPDYRRLVVDLPTQEARAAACLLGGLPAAQNLSVLPVTYEPEEFFTLVEDPGTELLVPAVQRPHIRSFAKTAPEWRKSGAAERLISGVWRGAVNEYDIRSIEKIQKRRYLDQTLLWDGGRQVMAIRAERISELYGHVKEGRLDFRGVGETVTDFLGALSEAVQARIAERSRS